MSIQEESTFKYIPLYDIIENNIIPVARVSKITPQYTDEWNLVRIVTLNVGYH